MEPRAHLDQSGDPAPDPHGAGVRSHDAADQLEQGALAGAVQPEQGHRLTLLHRQRDAVERLELIGELMPLHGQGRELLEGAAAAQHEALGDVVDLDGVQRGHVTAPGRSGPRAAGRPAARARARARRRRAPRRRAGTGRGSARRPPRCPARSGRRGTRRPAGTAARRW